MRMYVWEKTNKQTNKQKNNNKKQKEQINSTWVNEIEKIAQKEISNSVNAKQDKQQYNRKRRFSEKKKETKFVSCTDHDDGWQDEYCEETSLFCAYDGIQSYKIHTLFVRTFIIEVSVTCRRMYCAIHN